MADYFQSHFDQECLAWAFTYSSIACRIFTKHPAIGALSCRPEKEGGAGLGHFMFCGWRKGQGSTRGMPGRRGLTASQEWPHYPSALRSYSGVLGAWGEVLAGCCCELGAEPRAELKALLTWHGPVHF